MASELGYVTNMVLDRNTICGNHLEVTEEANRSGVSTIRTSNVQNLSTLPILREQTAVSVTSREQRAMSLITDRRISSMNFQEDDMSCVALAICHNTCDLQTDSSFDYSHTPVQAMQACAQK